MMAPVSEARCVTSQRKAQAAPLWGGLQAASLPYGMRLDSRQWWS